MGIAIDRCLRISAWILRPSMSWQPTALAAWIAPAVKGLEVTTARRWHRQTAMPVYT
jgi:hypothetical protein